MRCLRFLGPAAGAPGDVESAPAAREPQPLLLEGAPLEAGAAIEIVRRRSPWSPHRPVERVIAGSHRARADILLGAPDIRPEHIRLYLPRHAAGPNDLKAIVEGTVWVNGRSIQPEEWCTLEPGDEIDLGRWRFRFEVDSAEKGPGTESPLRVPS